MRHRILYQLTSPMHRTLGVEEIARRRAYLSKAAAPDVVIDVWPLADGPSAVESNADAARVVPELLRTVPKWIAESYEAVVVGCFSDPGVAAIRDLTDIPVIGPGGSAMRNLNTGRGPADGVAGRTQTATPARAAAIAAPPRAGPSQRKRPGGAPAAATSPR